MTVEEKDQIREQIGSDIETLEVQIKALEEKLQPIEASCCLDDVGREELLAEQEVNRKILEGSVSHLEGLQRAIYRIDSPTFGICIECEEPIGFERMRIRPESVKCVDCAGS